MKLAYITNADESYEAAKFFKNPPGLEPFPRPFLPFLEEDEQGCLDESYGEPEGSGDDS
eukprot:gene19343-9_t